VNGGHLAAEHALDMLSRTRLIAQKMQHDTHHPIADVRVDRIGTVHCEAGEAFSECARLAILAVDLPRFRLRMRQFSPGLLDDLPLAPLPPNIQVSEPEP